MSASRGLALAAVLWIAFGSAMAAEPPSAEVSPRKRAGRVLFSSDRSGEWRIWTVNADGSGMRQLTRGTPEDSDVDPAFSPDGSAILFTSTRGEATGVWRMLSDASELERICGGDQAEWSPDGKQITFRRDGRILTRHLASGREKVISPEGWALCSGPSWSPDGQAIAFACRWEAGNAIFTVGADGGRPTEVYDKQGACEPHWSPDGSQIVYETETNIWTIRPDGTGNRPVTWFGGVQRCPRWSPDGQSLVFCQGPSERGPWELYVIPARGGNPEKLTEGGSDIHPYWQAVPGVEGTGKAAEGAAS